MKVSVNTILSFMVGEMPVVASKDDKKLQKLRGEAGELRQHLPFVEETTGKSHKLKENKEKTRVVRTSFFMEKFPTLKTMEEAIKLDMMRLEKIKNRSMGEPTQEYFDICKKLILATEKNLGAKTVTLNFESENQQ